MGYKSGSQPLLRGRQVLLKHSSSAPSKKSNLSFGVGFFILDLDLIKYINWFEIHINEYVTMRKSEIKNMVMQNERGQNTHGQGERVKIPLLPSNVSKKSYKDSRPQQGHDSDIQ